MRNKLSFPCLKYVLKSKIAAGTEKIAQHTFIASWTSFFVSCFFKHMLVTTKKWGNKNEFTRWWKWWANSFCSARHFRIGSKIWYFKWGMKTLLCILNSVLSMNEQNFFYKKSHQRRGMKSGEYGTSLKIVQEVFSCMKSESLPPKSGELACLEYIIIKAF